MDEHPATALGSIEIGVLAGPEGEAVKVPVIAPDRGVEAEHVTVGKAVDRRLVEGVAVQGADKFHEVAVIVLSFAGAHQPLAVIANRVVAVLVRPVGISGDSVNSVIVGEAPLVIDPEEGAIGAIVPVALEKVVGDRFLVFAELEGVSIDDPVDELIFVGRVTEEIEEIAGQPVVVIP